MHRLICLFTLCALVACGDAPATEDAPIEPGACGMTLPGVGTWTVAEYSDGYLIDANREIALRTAGDDLWWYRLDGTDGGPLTLGAPYFQNQRVDLYGTEYVVVRGTTEDFRDRSRLIRLADNRILYEFEWSFEARGEWIVTGNTRREGVPNPRLRSLKTGKSFELPCVLCTFVALDRFGRAWLHDIGGELVEVDLATGRATEHPDLWSYRANAAGAGLRVGDGEGALLFGAESTPVDRCQRSNAYIARNGLIGCPGDGHFEILRADGTLLRSAPDVEGWLVQEFGPGFLTQGAGNVDLIPFDPSAAVEHYAGRLLASTAQVALVRDRDSDSTAVLHADGRRATIDFAITSPPQISADSALAVVRRTEDFALVDLDTGAVVTPIALGLGTKRFAGHVLVARGARVGETPPSDLSHVLVPDRACPVMLSEQCAGTACTLNIQQFETGVDE